MTTESPAPYVSDVLHDLLKDWDDHELSLLIARAPELLEENERLKADKKELLDALKVAKGFLDIIGYSPRKHLKIVPDTFNKYSSES